MDENQDRCRVTENMQMAVGAGDIPGTTDMGSILGRSSEPSTEAALSQCAAGTLGRAPRAVWGPVMLTSSLPFSQPASSGLGAAQISRESERAGAGALGHNETVGEARPDGVPMTARVPDTAPMVPTTARVPDTAPMETPRPGVGARQPRRFACGGGDNLADESAFVAQAELAAQATGWYRHYVSLLRRLTSGHTPVAVVTSCGQGGLVEGIRRAGGAAHGQDCVDQPRYRERFGRETFSVGGPDDVSRLRELRSRSKAFVTLAAAAKPHGGAEGGQALAGHQEVVDACVGSGGLYAVETAGSPSVGASHTCTLRGAYFGLHVDRPRSFEANFDLRVDEALVSSGLNLRRGTCLGGRRQWGRLDAAGRPAAKCGCQGNLWAVQGTQPVGCTLAECAAAMGIDRDHMDFEGLTQAVPPVYGDYIFGQAAMREVERRFGLEAITFDEFLASPQRSRRRMSHWLRGAGGVSPDQGVELRGLAQLQPQPPTQPQPLLQPPTQPPRAPSYRPVFLEGEEAPISPPTAETVLESEARELYYSWAGDYDAMVGPAPWWASMDAVKSIERVGVGPALAALSGRNTLVFLPWGQTAAMLPRIGAVVRSSPGTRVTVHVYGAGEEDLLRRAGFRLVRRVRRGSPAYAEEGRDAVMARGGAFWAIGDASSKSTGAVDYALAEAAMDPRDRPGAQTEPSSAKAARSYTPIPWEKERWDIGLPRELDEIMARRGVGIYPWAEVFPTEVPFYRWESQEGLLKSITEADRGLLAGAMEYVPAHRLAEVLESSTISPWTIADQGGGKWRLCHDYSVGTNRVVPSAAFTLPSVWDARADIKPGSHFAKYDIRDGFWHVPIAEDSKKRLVVRHPGTGRLMWATRLPFGYIESPRLFCGITEAVIARLRKQCAGLGIHFHVFVDDVLVIGDTEELTRQGMTLLEAEFAARGLQWAPHKKRGPCRCIEFLGLLICNTEGLRGITITRKRRAKLASEIEAWLALEPVEGDLVADPRELASFLGKLVFVSQVVKGGRTYMQGMLSQFKGLVVDWQRGQVKPASAGWRDLEVSPAFWRDLRWWQGHLDQRSLAPLVGDGEAAEAVLTGTDASNWGTGQVLWLDGAREEASLSFTHAERRRPINWRELLGIVRVCEVGGGRLRGKTVLVETDNMAARGAASKFSSKAADMQELVRRLLRLSETHGFALRVTHTPGEKLDRPDQTSRGDAIEESRFRLRSGEFERLSARFGPFSSFIGAERELAQQVAPAAREGEPRRMWVHPTSSTVGSALRRVQEAMAEHMGQRPTALALVPADGDPAWSKMLRHGLVVGQYPAGSPCLAAHTLHGWQDCTNRRPISLVLFPRAAGASAVQLATRFTLERDVRITGSFVYALAEGGGVGSLCQVVSDDGDELVVEYWRLDLTKAARKVGPGPIFLREKAGVRESYEADPVQFWSVDHLVGPVVASAGGVVERRCFDFKRANTEIGLAGGVWSPTQAGWEATAEAEADAGPTAPPSPGGYVPFGDDLGGAEESLADVAADLGRLNLKQHAANRGSEGRVAPKEPRVRGGEPEGVSGVCSQPCQYGGGGIVCAGCTAAFALGERMESRGLGFVHARPACRGGADAAMVTLAEEERGRAAAPDVFFGVYSDAVGVSGVFNDLRLVEAATADGSVFSTSRSFVTHEEAARFIRSETVARATVPLVEPAVKGSLVKRAHLAEKLSDARLAMIDRCIAGQCGVAHDETSTACLGGCGRCLHVDTCAQMGRGFAALGNFRCVTCRLSELVVPGATAAPSREIETVVKRTMVLELNQGKETTAAGYADYTQLEERYALGMGKVLDGAALQLPRHNAESFKNFLTWMAIDADRARSVESVMRTAGAMMVKLGLPDVTKDGSVKAHAKDLLDGLSEEHEPATTATPTMLKWCVETGIGERFAHPGGFVAARERVQFLCEGVGGCRIGEVCGGGESHGILANNLRFIEDPMGTDELTRSVVEFKLEHSKTGFSRYLNMAAVTATSGLRVADAVMAYCRAAEFKMVTTVQAGVRVITPDFWVVRVSLLGLDERGLIKLMNVLRKDKSPSVAKHLDVTKVEAQRRYGATGNESQAKKYVNIASGDSTDKSLDELAARLTQLGYTAQKLPGPLLLATTGGNRQVPKLMPYSTSTASAPTKEILTSAWQAGCVGGASQDVDLDLEPGTQPKWSTHSLRRLGDTVARRYRHVTGVTSDQIDIYFGWQEKILLLAMQVHYATMSIRERMNSAKITGMM